jgi:hypothetical protein
MGSVPSWYPVMAAARYLGTDPWVLEAMPLVWTHRALAAQKAEDHAMEMQQKMAK